jgi:hypothetical protein
VTLPLTMMRLSYSGLCILAARISAAHASVTVTTEWLLSKAYNASNFFDGFNFFVVSPLVRYSYPSSNT